MNLDTLQTFRFFVSSTFSDFKKERDILRTEVFPVIKNYCEERGCTFQPIDLRWGINEEAQIDQKTLELCLNEVRNCKQYPYPNFLLMLGDRYGWIPLPYMIEKKEFELLLQNCSLLDQSLLSDWYILDNNHIPSSYILRERTNESIEPIIWKSIENQMLKALQKSAKCSLPLKKQELYFQSITELEIIEGLIGFRNDTENQSKILGVSPELKTKDSKCVLAFLRKIHSEKSVFNTGQFLDKDREKVEKLKKELKEVLPKENIIEASTTQIEEDKLDEGYLYDFKKDVINFLKAKLDEQFLINSNKSTYSVQDERKLHLSFAKQKRRNFIGRTETLKRVREYILNDDLRPLVICGPSGMGKSTLIAKAIEETEKLGSHQVVFRFLGITNHSTKITTTILSILKELNADFEYSSKQNNNTGKDLNGLNLEEDFNNWSFLAHDKFLTISEPTVLFIDAIDQLGHIDDFYWLPEILTKNLKIILTVLKDTKYEYDTYYYNNLKKRTSNILELPKYHVADGMRLLSNLLALKKRRLQPKQRNYFKKCYLQNLNPLFIKLAAEELKDWHSFDSLPAEKLLKNGKKRELSNTLKQIVIDFIDNLSKFKFHNPELVKRVLDFMPLSGIGISQYETITLLNLDKNFVRTVVSNTYHVNISHQVPDIIWIRFYRDIEPFLKLGNSDLHILHLLFHREFTSAIKNSSSFNESCEIIINNTFKKVFEIQKHKPNQNRWGELFLNVLVIATYEFEREKIKKHVVNLTKINTSWLSEFMFQLNLLTKSTIESSDFDFGFAYIETYAECAEALFRNDNNLWSKVYIKSIINFCYYFRTIENPQKNLKYAELGFEKVQTLYNVNKEKWVFDYLYFINELSGIYSLYYKFEDAISIAKIGVELTKKLYSKEPKKFGSDYIRLLGNLGGYHFSLNNISTSTDLFEIANLEANKINSSGYMDSFDFYYIKRKLAHLYFTTGKVDNSKEILIEILPHIKENYKKSPTRWIEELVMTMISLADSYLWLNKTNEGIETLELAISTLKPHYKKNSRIYAYTYSQAILQLAPQYSLLKEFDSSLKKLKEAESVIKPLYKEDRTRWSEHFAHLLYHFASHFFECKKNDKAIFYAEESYEIWRKIYKSNNKFGLEQMCLSSGLLASCYRANKEIDRALQLQEKVLNLLENAYNTDSERWVKRYVWILGDLAYTAKENQNIEYGISLEEKALKIIEKRFEEHPNQWANDYASTLNNLGFSYEWTNQIKKSLVFHKKSIAIRRDLFSKHKERWVWDYANSLDNLQRIYFKLKNWDKALKYSYEATKAFKNLYKEDNDKYIKKYIDFKSKKALFLKMKRNYKDAIFVKKSVLKILKTHFDCEPEIWAELYSINQNELAQLYEKDGQLDRSISLERKNLELRKYYYDLNSNYWSFMYFVSLNNLSNTLTKQKKYHLALPLQLKAFEISKTRFAQNPNKELDFFIHSYRSLKYTYQCQEKMEEEKKLLLEVKFLIAKNLGENHKQIAHINQELKQFG